MNNTYGICRIGIIPYSREDGSQYFPEGYIRGIEQTGAEAVPIPHETPLSTLLPLVVSLDGIVFSGGPDVDPVHYGQARDPLCERVDRRRDRMELALMDLVLGRDLPALCICRGMQLQNVALGGTLRQHISGHRCEPDQEEELWHEVRVEPDSRVQRIVQTPAFRVNSFHHQVVDRLGEGLRIAARADDGATEAIELPEKRFALGVQWHPEKSLEEDAFSPRFFRALREAIPG